MVKAKKYLGQHFLNNKDIASRIADQIKGRNNVVEIGPGTGMLTRELLDSGIENLLVIEKDEEATEFLEQGFPKLRIVKGDVLQTDWKFFGEQTYSLIGNLPYNISSPIFFKLMDYRDFISDAVFMIQYEVGERILSKPGNKTYGILSVLLQLLFEVNRVMKVGPGNFNPPPKVDSMVISLSRNEQLMDESLYQNLKKLVKASFGQRRKKIKNALSGSFDDLFFLPTEFVSKRAEELSPDDFLCMAKELSGDQDHAG